MYNNQQMDVNLNITCPTSFILIDSQNQMNQMIADLKIEAQQRLQDKYLSLLKYEQSLKLDFLQIQPQSSYNLYGNPVNYPYQPQNEAFFGGANQFMPQQQQYFPRQGQQQKYLSVIDTGKQFEDYNINNNNNNNNQEQNFQLKKEQPKRNNQIYKKTKILTLESPKKQSRTIIQIEDEQKQQQSPVNSTTTANVDEKPVVILNQNSTEENINNANNNNKQESESITNIVVVQNTDSEMNGYSKQKRNSFNIGQILKFLQDWKSIQSENKINRVEAAKHLNIKAKTLDHYAIQFSKAHMLKYPFNENKDKQIKHLTHFLELHKENAKMLKYKQSFMFDV